MNEDVTITTKTGNAATNVTATSADYYDEICIMSWNVASLTTTIDRLKKEDDITYQYSVS